MQTIKEQDWQSLPAHAQQEVYDFFLFVKQRYERQAQLTADTSETLAFSNYSASHVEEWLTDKEDEIWN
jgi:hypothetical protein